jgi:hypothetical protein
VGRALVRTLVVGLVASAVLVILSDLPFIGSIINFPGLNWVIWIGVWAWLADQFVKSAKPALAASDNPSMPAMGAGALIGLTSGFAGQLLQLAIQLVILSVASEAARTGSSAASTAAMGSAFSAFGSMIALFLYPAFGAFWGGLFGLLWGMRVRRAQESIAATPAPVGTPQA